MELMWLLALLVCCTAISTDSDQANGLDCVTDKPIQISDQDLNSLLENVFPSSGFNDGTTSTNSPPIPPSEGRGPEEEIHETNVETPEDCECVPYYQCSTNRTIIENGEGLIDIRIKTGPCEDYMDVCCKVADTLEPEHPITPTPPPVPQPNSDVCGQRNYNGVSTLRITGGVDNEAQFGEFPWMVAIIRKDIISTDKVLNVYQCGGSLIHPQVVLTAAHCAKDKLNLSVRVGEWDTQRKTEPLPTQTRPVKNIVIHEQYYAGALWNDIALLFLESPVELAPNVGLICLPEQGENMDHRDCVASGWGKDVFGKEGKYQVILKKVELPIVSRTVCIDSLRNTRLGPRFKLHSSFICAGGVPGKDTCKGDGGSPLVCPSSDNAKIYIQSGIVAWGIGCGTEVPGVYVDVAQFRDWIDNQLSLLNIVL